MDYRILGPLEVSDDDRPVAVGGEKQRALLAMLLLHAGEVVSADRLIDDLWGERSPAVALNALQVHISRLRKALDSNGAGRPLTDEERDETPSGGVLVTRGRGYLIRVVPGELDLDRFQGMVEEGRQALARGDARRAAEMLCAGLAMWRGPPLADFTFEAFAQAPIAQLEELRLGVVEDRVEADLALGRHEQLVGELAALVKQNPLRERLRMQLMLALYRCGRQAEALDVYQEYRRGLAEELGLDPSPRLQQLQTAILARDPSLEVPLDDPAPAEDAAPMSRPRRAAGKRGRLAIGVLALVGVAAVAAVIGASGSGVSRLTIAPDSIGGISPARGVVTADVPVGSSPSSVAAGDRAVWVANYDAGTVSRIDPSTRAVVAPIPAGSTPGAVAVGAGAVWVANLWSGTVSRIDPGVNRVVQSIPVGNGPSGVSVGFGSVWVANSSDGTLSRIDATTGAWQSTIRLGGGASDVAAGLGGVWVSDEASGRVLRVDPQTDRVTATINVGDGPTAITVGFGSVWVTDSLERTVSRIDPQTNQVAATIPVGNGPNAIAAGSGAVWVANEFAGSVSRIDPATNLPRRSIRVGGRPEGVAVAGDLVWVDAQASDTSHRGGTLTVLDSGPPGTFDPALAWPARTLLTNDGLTALERVGGSDGVKVVPDLAVSLPAPTDGGLTYTFQLRRGIRYADGEPVRPEDFLRAIERDFKLGDPLAPVYYRNLVGGPACVAHPARCELSRGVVADDSAGTVTFHLTSPDPELLDRLTLSDAVAVPAGTPNHDVGQHPIPATGAYELASITRREVRLVRNRYFHVWSQAARPDGYPDQIVEKIGASPSAELTAVERGTADITNDAPADRLTEVETRFASQVHTSPSAALDLLVMNTRVAPFNDLRVRQALNYAVDRGKIASLVGSASQPTCQFLTRYIPGYQRFCPYTLAPSAAGTWSAPDLALAERLIAASHTRGTAITLWDFGITGPGDPAGVGRYIVSLLDRLGYHATLKNRINDLAATQQFGDSRTNAQIGLANYLPSYPAASEYINWALSCQNFLPDSTANPNVAEFCDPQLDGQIHQALAAEERRSPAAPGIWAQADRTVTNQAPQVPLVVLGITDVVSRRVGNYQFGPMWGVYLDQLWVK